VLGFAPVSEANLKYGTPFEANVSILALKDASGCKVCVTVGTENNALSFGMGAGGVGAIICMGFGRGSGGGWGFLGSCPGFAYVYTICFGAGLGTGFVLLFHCGLGL